MDETRNLPLGATTALALGGGAALSLGVAHWIWTGTDADEAASIGFFLLGWTLLAFAAILCAVCLVSLLSRIRSATRREVLLVAAGTAAVVATIVLHPLSGSGSA